MLKKAALEFGRALVDLTVLEVSCKQTRNAHPEVLVDPTGQLEGFSKDIFGNVKRACILGDLQEVLPEIDRFISSLNGSAKIEDIKSSCEHLRYRIYDELQNEYYLQIDRQDVRFYEQKELFGPRVAKKFKAAAADIENAGNCIAIQQATACIFHLMRAMEVAVRSLGKRLNVTIAPQTTWRQITSQMDDKIKKMPEVTEKQKNKKNDWEAVRTNLHHVGSVWRNKTMHPAASYTRSQARDVFDACRVFMNALCEL